MPSFDSLELVCLATFLLATPVAAIAVFALGCNREWWAVANSYGFSVSYCILYMYPLLAPRCTAAVGFTARLHKATMLWAVWLSCFTELAFQPWHNLFVRQLHEQRGTVLEWPFYAYGLTDARWSQYNGGHGLEPEVWLINVNDAGWGFLVAIALVHQRLREGSWERPSLFLILTLLFRDATLWRETVEYMWDHHRNGYPHSTADAALRPHAIACLWTVNGLWLVAPLLTIVWAHQQLRLRGKAAKEA
jgi:hypothetical protein